MKTAAIFVLASLALAASASGHTYGCRAWAVLVFLSVTAFALALLRVHVAANAPRRDR